MNGLGVIPGTTGAVDPSSTLGWTGTTGAAAGTGVGQHGVTPLNMAGGTVGQAFNQVWAWLNRPFTTNMSPIDVGLLIGVVIISVMVWNLVLYHIRIAAETI